MADYFKEVSIYSLKDNVFQRIGKDWMLITAGSKEHFNTMTAAWGGWGFLWQKPVVFIFVRPNRYTYEFTEKNDFFTLSFFEPKYQDILQFCGTNSGRDVDKIKETGLIPLNTDNGNVYFQQSNLVIECRKLYYDDIEPGKFLDSSLDAKMYPKQDYHRVYTGEVISCMVK
jgi:flavin reductase (DIM6/NTAB) family NADH-FMN oxidoreductase RutF